MSAKHQKRGGRKLIVQLFSLDYKRNSLSFLIEALLILAWTSFVLIHFSLGLERWNYVPLAILIYGAGALITAILSTFFGDELHGALHTRLLGLFATLVFLADSHDYIDGVLQLLFLLPTSYLVFYYFFSLLWRALEYFSFERTPRNFDGGTKKLFVLVFAAVLILDLSYLFLFVWPSVFTNDTLTQLKEILSGNFENSHPYWHTRYLGIFIQLGTLLGGNINFGLGLYNVFQILVMALIFAFCAVSLYEFGLPKPLIGALSALFVLAPYNIAYGSTPWKDILFSMMVLLFAMSSFRLIAHVGEKRGRDLVLLALSLILIGIFRNNGVFALIAILAVLVAQKSLANDIKLVSIAAIAIALILRFPVINLLGVVPTRLTESLSLPSQQVARAIRDNYDEISAEDRAMVDPVISSEAVRYLYGAELSDAIKYNMDGDYLAKHLPEYGRFWLAFGLKYPYAYFCAWVDITRGFSNPVGIKYWAWLNMMLENDIGVERSINPEDPIPAFFYHLDNYWYGSLLVRLLIDIGFHVWLFIFLLSYLRARKQTDFVILFAPIAGLLFSLFIGTPAFAEFRYIYSLFLCMPVYLALSLVKKQGALELDAEREPTNSNETTNGPQLERNTDE